MAIGVTAIDFPILPQTIAHVISRPRNVTGMSARYFFVYPFVGCLYQEQVLIIKASDQQTGQLFSAQFFFVKLLYF